VRIALPRLSFSTTMRVVDRVHNHTSNVGTLTLPPCTTSLADNNVFMINVTDLTNRSHASRQDLAHLAGLQTNLNVGPITPHNLGRSPGAADQLTTLARLQFNVVNRGTKGNIHERQRIPRPDLGANTGLHLIIDGQSYWGKNVTLLTIRIVQQGNS